MEQKEEENLPATFIVDLWAGIFEWLSKISVFFWIRFLDRHTIKKLTDEKNKYLFPEIWVLGNLIVATILSVSLPFCESRAWIIFFTIYAVERCFEILIYQINVLLFEPYRVSKAGKEYKIKSPTRMVVLLLHNAFEFVIWFVVIYISSDLLTMRTANSVGDYYMRSFLLFTNLDTGFLGENRESILLYIGVVEVLVGLFMTILCLARFIGVLPGIRYIGDNYEPSMEKSQNEKAQIWVDKVIIKEKKRGNSRHKSS